MRKQTPTVGILVSAVILAACSSATHRGTSTSKTSTSSTVVTPSTPSTTLTAPVTEVSPTVVPPAATPSTSPTTTEALPTAANDLAPGPTQFEVEPTTIGLSGDGSDIVQDIRWAAWEQSGATGHGTVNIESCTPSCAQGAQTPTPVTIYLNDAVNGKFTLLTEDISGGRPQNFPLVGNGWQRPSD